MRDYRFRLLNVFAIDGDSFSGNPLCVFEDARGLDDAAMQALARQFNLSETTFVLPSEQATAKVRIFTPSFELAFAGHPTLGTAQVVRSQKNCGDELTLEMKVGVIPVNAQGERWTLRAITPQWRSVQASRGELAEMLGVDERDIGEQPLWMNAGSEQLIVPLRSAEAVSRCKPVVDLLKRHGKVHDDRFLVYAWAHDGADAVTARFFFAKDNGCIEDPATGSACANLGGWFVAAETSLPVSKRISQGSVVKRPSQLFLRVDQTKQIFVSGLVTELGGGVIGS